MLFFLPKIEFFFVIIKTNICQKSTSQQVIQKYGLVCRNFPKRVRRILENPDIPLPLYHPLGHRTAPPVVRWCSFHIPRLRPALRSLQVPPLGSGPATPQHPVGSGSGNEDPQSGSCYSQVTVKIKKPFVFKAETYRQGQTYNFHLTKPVIFFLVISANTLPI